MCLSRAYARALRLQPADVPMDFKLLMQVRTCSIGVVHKTSNREVAGSSPLYAMVSFSVLAKQNKAPSRKWGKKRIRLEALFEVVYAIYVRASSPSRISGTKTRTDRQDQT